MTPQPLAPTSAKQLRKQSPALAESWASYITENKAAIIKQVAGRIVKAK